MSGKCCLEIQNNETYKISMHKLGKKGESLEDKELLCGRNKTEAIREFSGKMIFCKGTINPRVKVKTAV